MLLFIFLFALLPLPIRSESMRGPDCSKTDCTLLNYKQEVQTTYYPAAVTLVKQMYDSKNSGEPFLHSSEDSTEDGIYPSEVIRNSIIALALGLLFEFLVVPRLRRDH